MVDITERRYQVQIPNFEIKALFQSIVRDWFKDKVIGNDLNSILKDLVTLNLKEFEKKFEILVRQMFSYMDVVENTAENFYHAFVLRNVSRTKRQLLRKFQPRIWNGKI